MLTARVEFRKILTDYWYILPSVVLTEFKSSYIHGEILFRKRLEDSAGPFTTAQFIYVNFCVTFFFR